MTTQLNILVMNFNTNSLGSWLRTGGMPPSIEGNKLPKALLPSPLSMDCSADSPSGFSRSKSIRMILNSFQ